MQSDQRLASLDQFRGYTVAGMLFVNFLGSFLFIRQHLPNLGHWHTYCSFADTIMPQFFFAVGFAYRLTYLRRCDQEGVHAARVHAVRRNLGLLLIGFIIHHLDGNYKTFEKLRDTGFAGFLTESFQRNFFQTLTHIALTSLLILPVVGKSIPQRLGMMATAALLFHIFSENGYYQAVLKRPGIDGGPLGFLTWTIPMIAGTLAYDAVSQIPDKAFGFMLAMACGFMLAGYGLSCLNLVTYPNGVSEPYTITSFLLEPPFVAPSQPVNIWTMSQRAGSISYLTFGAGFAMLVFALFYQACDRMKWIGLGLFKTFGTNALAAYILHGMVESAIGPFAPKDSPWTYIVFIFAIYFAICTIILRALERRGLILKI